MTLLLSVRRSALVVTKVSLHPRTGSGPEGLSVALWVSSLQRQTSENLRAVKSAAPSPADRSQLPLCTRWEFSSLKQNETLEQFSPERWTVPFHICMIFILISSVT